MLAQPLMHLPENVAVSPAALRRTLAEIRREGWRPSAAARPQPLVSVAAPIFGARRQGGRRAVGRRPAGERRAPAARPRRPHRRPLHLPWARRPPVDRAHRSASSAWLVLDATGHGPLNGRARAERRRHGSLRRHAEELACRSTPPVASKFHLLEGIESFEAGAGRPGDPRPARRVHVDHRRARAAGGRRPRRRGPGPARPGPGARSTRRPAAAPTCPCLVWLHGGAFRMGDLDMPEADWTARQICERAGAVVVSVDYRLCVGGVTYPVPHDDVVAAVRWVRDNAAALGIDPDRISLGGASAGGNLATGAALRLRDDDGWVPAALLLAYTTFHAVVPPPSAVAGAAAGRDPAAAPLPPRGPPRHHRELPRRPGEPRRRLRDAGATPSSRGSAPCCCSTPSTTTCAPRPRSSPGSSTAAGVDVRQVTASRACCTASSTCTPASSRSTRRSG